MRNPLLIGAIVCALCLPGIAQAQDKAAVASKGERFEVKTVLKAEGTTVVLFYQDTSVIEQQFLTELQKQLPDDKKVALTLVRLKDTSAPAAQQYKIEATPTAIIYDRFGRELARTSQPEEIRAAVRKGQLMGRLKWIDEDDPKAPEFYGAPAAAIKHGIPGIMKTMTLRPDAFKMFNMISDRKST